MEDDKKPVDKIIDLIEKLNYELIDSYGTSQKTIGLVLSEDIYIKLLIDIKSKRDIPNQYDDNDTFHPMFRYSSYNGDIVFFNNNKSFIVQKENIKRLMNDCRFVFSDLDRSF